MLVRYRANAPKRLRPPDTPPCQRGGPPEHPVGGATFKESINKGLSYFLAVLENVFHLILGTPSPGGSRGRVRIVISLRRSKVLGQFRPGSGGNLFVILILALSAASTCVGSKRHHKTSLVGPMGTRGSNINNFRSILREASCRCALLSLIYMCHRGRLGWSGTSGLRQNRGTSTH